MTVIHGFAAAARKFPDRDAIHAGGRTLSYRELAASVESIRALIADRHADRRRIGVLTGDDVSSYASTLAILANGSAYVPIHHDNPPDRVRTIIEEADLDVVLAHAPHDGLEAVGNTLGVAILDTRDLPAVAGELQVAEIAPDDLAYIFFTSGSTGRPKGVPIPHRCLDSFLDVVLGSAGYELGPDDRFLQMFEQTFDLSVMTTFAPLSIGASLWVVPEEGISYMNIISTLEEREITVALMVPSVLFYLQRFFDEIRLERLRLSLFCGEALPQALVEGWSQCVPRARIQNVYGPTEATIWCLTYDWDAKIAADEAWGGIVAIGTPMPRMDAIVVDEARRPVAPGEKGELCLIGAQVADEYWRNSEKTSDAFVRIEGIDGTAYRTGDIAFVNENGKFVYCGRADHQVKVDGHRIELAEIEHWVRECSGPVHSAVVPKTTPEGGTSLTLFVEAGGTPVDEVKAFLRAKLPPYMQPRRTRVIERMPLNANGKVDRRALAAL